MTDALRDLVLHDFKEAVDWRPLVLVGGIREPILAEDVARAAGVEVDWIESRGFAPRTHQPLLERVRRGHVGALIILRYQIAHSFANGLVAAAKRAGVPFTSVRSPGRAQLKRALNRLAEHLQRERRPSQ